MPSAPHHMTVGIQEGNFVSQLSLRSYGDHKCSVNNTKKYPPGLE